MEQIKKLSKELHTAVILLWASLVLGVVRTVMQIMAQDTTEKIMGGFIIATPIILIVAWLIYKIGKGKEWARIAYLIIFIIGITPAVGEALIYLEINTTISVLRASDILLSAIAVFILFKDSSAKYFK
jgi:hypothetical protein|tara:strand:+ start:140 stop:523 length:384 start_codon:yes stop_codon:yes gene_type:complete